MKKIITLLLLLCSLCSVSFANGQEVINSFKAFVADLVAPVEATYGKVAYYELKGQWKESSDFSLSYFKCKQN